MGYELSELPEKYRKQAEAKLGSEARDSSAETRNDNPSPPDGRSSLYTREPLKAAKGGTRTEPYESEEQEALFQWAEAMSGKYPCLRLMYHVPNGGHRSAAVAGKLKAEGVKAGVPDICLPSARGGYHGLYIELKAGKNKATKEQKEWLSALSEEGYKAVVCRGWVNAAEEIKNYLEES